MKKKLGELLIEKNIITEEQLHIALDMQKENRELLGVLLVKLGYVSEEDVLLPIIADQWGFNYIRLKNVGILPEVINLVPAKVAVRFNVIPVSFQEDELTVAMVKPFDILAHDELQMITSMKIKGILASKRDIADAIGKYYGVGVETIDKIMDSAVPVAVEKEEVPELDKMESDATISRFLNQILLDAVKRQATDIHIEPFENELIIRYRIDGILYDINVPKNVQYFKASINSRIKIMSSLDISEKRLPQDGRFRMRVEGVEIDLRISFIPTTHGESVVLRILNTSQFISFDQLDLSKRERTLFEDLIRRPNGIIFITGPTGSGKTSTLYSCLSEINTVDKKIITIEDPVEYQLRNITQVQINSQIKFTFARGLRSILRHDPDVIMVGEVRDVETAEIAIQVALTGHLVFSTLHTNDAASGITRLINMGIEPYLISSTVECFIAQRLVRVICSHCKKVKELSAKMLKELKVDSKEAKNLKVYEGRGCKACGNTGYFGRTSIFEILLLSEDINELILARVSSEQIKAKAIDQGMVTLRQSGWEKVKRGITTPEEVIRVTQERSRRKL